jgi:hypothetical protein
MFRQIFRFANLVGLTPDMIKPNDVKAKYAELKPAHCEITAVDKTETKFKVVLPKLDCKVGRASPFGYTFIVCFHPILRMGSYIVEGEVGKDILAELGPIVVKDMPPYIARIYEVDTALKGM